MEARYVPARTIPIGTFELDTQSAELCRDGRRVRLADQPFQILMLLLARRGEVVTREELQSQLWPGDTFVDFDRSLNSAIKKLRDALGDSADAPRFIETIPRRGYRWIEPTAAEGPKRTRSIAGVIVAIAAVVLAVLIAAWFSRPSHRPIHSLAVLPLANLTGDPAQDYFADGMTEMLITDLAQMEDVRVVSRTSIAPYKNTRKSVRDIGRELHADAIVEGGVLRSGDRIRVTVQVIEAAGDRHLWARSYERSQSDVVALQRELSSEISDAIQAKLMPDARARMHTAQRVDPKAYDFFLRGTRAVAEQKAAAILEAIGDLQEAIRIQPDFAPAYAWLAIAYSQHAWGGAVPPHDFMTDAKAAAQRAVALDAGLPLAHKALARVLYQYDWNWTASEEEFRKALALNPNDASTHGAYGAFLRMIGRTNEARRESQRVRELDPLVDTTPDGILNSAVALRTSGDYVDAIARMREVVRMDPSFRRAHFQLGWTLVEAGQMKEGIAELERAVELTKNANIRFRARLAWACALAGDTAKARAILTDLQSRSRTSYVAPTSLAIILVALHDNDHALDQLETAARVRDFELITLAGDKTLEPLHGEPRFRELMRTIRLPEPST